MIQERLELDLLAKEQLLTELHGRRRCQTHEGAVLLRQLLLLPLPELHPLLEEGLLLERCSGKRWELRCWHGPEGLIRRECSVGQRRCRRRCICL